MRVVERGADVLRYRVLGPLEVWAADRPVDPGPPTQRAVLAVLVADAGRPVGTAELIGRIWGPDGDDDHRAALQVAVSRLRKRLAAAGEQPISTVTGGYRLQAARDAVDAWVFEDQVSSARRAVTAGRPAEARELVEQALASWRGRPLADVAAGVDDVVAGWVEQRAAALELAAELDLALGRHVELCRWLPREIAEHPLREGLRGDLMVALYRSGRQAEALEVFDRARRLLGEDLGIDPSPDLQRVHALVLRHDPALDLSPVNPEPAPAPVPARGMVGRAAERARAAHRVTGAGGGAQLLVVTGEAGIGKSRLVEDAVAALPADRAVARGRLLDQEGLPAYWPWVHVVDDLDRARPDVVTPLLQGPAAALLRDGPGASSRGELFRAVAALVEAVAGGTPLVVVLEDLHWADPETVDLTEHLLWALDRSPVTFVWTVRTPLPDGAPAARLLVAAARHPRADVLALTGLDPDAVQVLTAQHLGAPVGRESAQRLRDRTGGNPFFLVELTRLLAQERTAHGRATGPVPDGVRAVVEQRLRHLAPGTRATLTAAAVHGRDLDVRLLAEVQGTTPAALVEALDEATRAGLLVPAGPAGRLAFAHALVQETLVQTCGPMHRRALHAEVAAALERRHGASGGDVAGIIAGHLVAAGSLGDPRRAAELSILAAAAARRRCAVGEAARHLRQTLGLLDLQPGLLTPAEELDVRVQLGALMTTTMSYDQEEVRAQAHLVAELSPDRQPLAAAVAGLWAAWGLAMAGGSTTEAEALAAQLRSQAGRDGDGLLALAVHDVLGSARHHAGRIADAREELLAAVRAADDLRASVDLAVFVHHPAATTRALLAHVELWADDVEASDRWAREARATAADVGDPYTTVFVDAAECNRLAMVGDAVTAAVVARRARDGARQLGAEGLATADAAVVAWADAVRAPEPGPALDELADAVAGYRSVSSGYEGLQLLLLGDALLQRGRPGAALDVVAEGITVARAHGEGFALPGLLLARAQALTAAAGRATPEAEDAAAEAAELARAGGMAWVLRAVPGVLAGTGGWRPPPR